MIDFAFPRACLVSSQKLPSKNGLFAAKSCRVVACRPTLSAHRLLREHIGYSGVEYAHGRGSVVQPFRRGYVQTRTVRKDREVQLILAATAYIRMNSRNPPASTMKLWKATITAFCMREGQQCASFGMSDEHPKRLV